MARTRSPVRTPPDPAAFLRLALDEATLIHLTHLPTLPPLGLDLPGDNVLEVAARRGWRRQRSWHPTNGSWASHVWSGSTASAHPFPSPAVPPALATAQTAAT